MKSINVELYLSSRQTMLAAKSEMEGAAVQLAKAAIVPEIVRYLEWKSQVAIGAALAQALHKHPDFQPISQTEPNLVVG